MRLSPRDYKMGLWHMQVGSVELEQGHYDASIDELHKAIESGYRSYIPYADLAAAYALQGKMDEASFPGEPAHNAPAFFAPGDEGRWAC